MTDDSLIDTRTVIRTKFEPWMLGRNVEVSIDRVKTWAGRLEMYQTNPSSWQWVLEGYPAYTHKQRDENAGYSTYYTPHEYELVVTVIVPSNWDHFGVDGLDAAR